MELKLLILFFLLALSFLFSGSEAALFSILEIEIENIKSKRIRGWIRQLLRKQEESLFIILLGNNIVNSYASALFPSIIGGILGLGKLSHSLKSLLDILVFTLILLVIGEITPKLLAIDAPDLFLKRAIFFFYPLYYLLRFATRPFTLVLEKITSLSKRIYEEEEILRDLEELSIGSRSGLRSGVSLVLYTAVDIMTPRKDVVYLDASMKIKDVKEHVKKFGFDHYPVREGSRDNVKGIFEINNPALLRAHDDDPILDYMEEVTFIPPTKRVLELLRISSETGKKMFVVVDEYGGVLGIVTIGDILRLLGVKKEKVIKWIDRSALMVPGDFTVNELEDIIRISFKTEATTVQGLIMERTGELPDEGDKVEVNGIIFEIVEKDRGEIKRVRVRKV